MPPQVALPEELRLQPAYYREVILMSEPRALTTSLEDYLEAIFNIISEKEAVRPKDIANRLKVSNASVTGALRSLAEMKLIRYAPYDVISMTQGGKAAAKEILRRHQALRDFFIKVLAVEYAVADKAACDIEHSISGIILERFIRFVEFVEACPRGGSNWIEGFAYRCDHGSARENCVQCVSSCLTEARSREPVT